MLRTVRVIGPAFLLFAASPAWGADGKYSIKTTTAPAPKELKPAIGKLLSDQAIQVLDDKGKPVEEIWLRKDVPVKATPQQLKNGLTYREVEETTLLGVVRFNQQATDYRRQRIKPGVYTLRLAYQPMDGDHMGTAPYNEFCLAVPARRDEDPKPLGDPKELHEKSTRATGTSHPGVFLLFPNPKPQDKPELLDKGNGHWVLFAKEEADAGGKKAPLGIALVVVGHAAE
jgi:hypothetical protein